MPLKTVALIAAVCLTTGWLLASVLTPPVARVQALPERRPQQPRGGQSDLGPFTEQLQLRLRQAPPAPVPRRNPFTFGSQPRDERPAPTQTSAVIETSAPPPLPVDVGPIYALSGMAVTSTPEGPVRTAVLTDGQTAHLVKAGDAIGGYKVVEVTEDTVTLAGAGQQYVLRMR